MNDKWQGRLTIIGFILLLGVMFIPDWNNIGKKEIGKVSTPFPAFEGLFLGDSVSKASSILDDKYGICCADENVTIEGGVDFLGEEFYSVDLYFYHGVLTEMTFEDVGSGVQEKQLFINAQSALISAFSTNANKNMVLRNADNYAYYDHYSPDSLRRYYDYLSINLEYSQFSPKIDKGNFIERQYGVVTVHVERNEYDVNIEN